MQVSKKLEALRTAEELKQEEKAEKDKEDQDKKDASHKDKEKDAGKKQEKDDKINGEVPSELNHSSFVT